MASKQDWLEAVWPTVRSRLPAPPAVVLDLGCGSLGGFVPAMLADGYRAVGIDPEAPEGSSYRRIEFERSELPEAVDAVVASVSLHHVADPGEVFDRIAGALTPGGVVVVLEWDWESFDEASARWAFERLDLTAESKGWLHGARERWLASGEPWDIYLRDWATGHGLHSAPRLVEALDERFERVSCERGAYLFPELTHTTEADELAAIEAGLLRAVRIDYVGRRR
ncbi:MAG TPA: methyltransferase domain-containing protein [Solirubrobacteraceae bacterium]|nr:methyltransferase domain-containing protein [Solirubrobacteraceae bacterium]